MSDSDDVEIPSAVEFVREVLTPRIRVMFADAVLKAEPVPDRPIFGPYLTVEISEKSGRQVLYAYEHGGDGDQTFELAEMTKDGCWLVHDGLSDEGTKYRRVKFTTWPPRPGEK
jgi:hypothetical protein